MPDIFSLSTDALYIIFAVVSAIWRASGVTVQSGTTGLLYTLGRVDRPVPLLLRPVVASLQATGLMKSVPRSVLEPGFHPLIPFFQRSRRVPTRARTLDLPAQRVATFEGYVFVADANLVFRVVDVKKALIIVDDLLHGMEQMLTLGVQEVLRDAKLRDLQSGQELDEKLRKNLEEKVRVWGVVVERAGFPSITPSPRTLRITQLRQNVMERLDRVEQLRAPAPDGTRLSMASAICAIGTKKLLRTKARSRRRRTFAHQHSMRLRRLLERKGHSGAAISRAAIAHRARARVH